MFDFVDFFGFVEGWGLGKFVVEKVGFVMGFSWK